MKRIEDNDFQRLHTLHCRAAFPGGERRASAAGNAGRGAGLGKRCQRESIVLYVSLLAFGAVIGIISGLLGIGGGIMLVPGLMVLFSFSQQEAQGTSLAALIPPIGIFAALVYYQHGYVRVPVAAAVAGGFMIGAYLGALLVPRLPVDALRLAFGALLLYLGCSFVLAGLPFAGFPPRTIKAAALPAGLAALITAIGAWLHGKRAPKTVLPPPDGHTEYHI
jgi:uncharacterized membrane protein YfcA